ncbi:MAG: exodeoxyribonuclease VII large subunit [Epsilonproteobacteria bacterium]|nr:exodeoxyribonuclease VII large subunit [Campylobacterota bacterium]
MVSVSELNEQIKGVVEATFVDVLVEGEVSRPTYHSSGHLYFSLRDEFSTIKCVMWRGRVGKMKFKLEDGMHIVVSGSVGLYTPKGEYQIVCSKIEPFGKGSLAVAFEQLKAKLEAKGYFDKSKKKPIPKFPKKIAVVSAVESAAVADILKIAKKRWPLTQFILVDSLVQGEGAKEEIAKAIKFADNLEADIILLARGGGSVEDLWSFNEEIVADAIFEAKTPVVSAIGHEIDYLISDFVADLRAPTPSGAMEMILPDINEYLYMLDEMEDELRRAINQKIEKEEQKLFFTKQELLTLSPTLQINEYLQKFSMIKSALKSQLEHKIELFKMALAPLEDEIKREIKRVFYNKERQIDSLKEQYRLNHPKNRVKDGFVEVVKDRKRVDICNLKAKEQIELFNGECRVLVEVVEVKKL